MSAAQRAYFGPRRKARRAAPARRRRRRRTVSAVGFANPRRRRTHRRRRVHVRARRNPRSHAIGKLSFRELTSGRAIRDLAIPAAIGGAGALALDVVWGMLPIPANFKTGQFAPLVKAVGVIAIGALASNMLPSKLVKPAVFASLTIMSYNFAKATLQQAMPNVPLGAYIDGHMGAYISGMGYIAPAVNYPTLNGYGDNAVAWSAADHDVVDMVS